MIILLLYEYSSLHSLLISVLHVEFYYCTLAKLIGLLRQCVRYLWAPLLHMKYGLSRDMGGVACTKQGKGRHPRVRVSQYK